jgi:hypothetical protein
LRLALVWNGKLDSSAVPVGQTLENLHEFKELTIWKAGALLWPGENAQQMCISDMK